MSTETPTHPTTALPRTYWWLFAAQLLGRSGAVVRAFLVLVLVRDKGFDPGTAALAASLAALADIASNVVGGWFADVFGRRPVAAAGTALSTGALVVLGVARDPGALLGSVAVFGLSGSFVFASLSAAVADVVPAGGRRRAFAHLYWAMNIGFAAASAVAGVVVDRCASWLFLVNAATTLVTGLIVVAATRPGGTHDDELAALAEATDDTAPPLRRDTLVALGRLALATTSYALAYAQVYALLPLHLGVLGVPGAVYGAAMAVNGIVVVATQPVASRLLAGWPQTRVHRASTAVFAAGIAATGLVGLVTDGARVAVLLGTVALWSLGEVGLSTVRAAMFVDLAPAGRRGLVASLPNVAVAVGLAAGPLVGVAASANLGDTAAWVALGTVAAMGAWLVPGSRASARAATCSLAASSCR